MTEGVGVRGPAWEPVPGPDELRERWRERSTRAGWSLPDDWWTPAIESVVTAACGAPGLAVACGRLGAARGRAGVGIGETLEDLGALFAELAWPDPPLSMVAIAAEHWAEAAPRQTPATCEDPLTGLLTPAYLRTRVAELCRAGETDDHALVLVDLVRRDGADEPWRRLGRAISVAGELREVFTGSQTLAVVGLSRAVALVRDGWRLGREVSLLRDRLRRTFGTRPGAAPGMFTVDDFEVRVVPLPATVEAAFAALAETAV